MAGCREARLYRLAYVASLALAFTLLFVSAAFAAYGQSQVAYFANGHINVVYADGRCLFTLPNSPSGSSLWWSPTGNRIVVPGEEYYRLPYGLAVYDVGSQRTLTIVPPTGVAWVEFGSWSPDGSRFVYRLKDDGWGYVVDAASGSKTRLAQGSSFKWSPDGTRIAYLHGAELRLRSYPGTADVKVCDLYPEAEGWTDPFTIDAWSKDGMSLYVEVTGQTYECRLADSALVALPGSPLGTSVGGKEFGQVSHDGRRLLYADGFPGYFHVEGAGIAEYDVAAATCTTLTPPAQRSTIFVHPTYSPDDSKVAYEEHWWEEDRLGVVLLVPYRGSPSRPLADGNAPAFRPTLVYPPEASDVRITNPIAYDLKSLQTTHFYTSVTVPNTRARLYVKTPKGNKVIFDGIIPTANTRFWFPAWNGMGVDGRRLPSATYDWVLQVWKNGAPNNYYGKIIIAKTIFTLSGRSQNGVSVMKSAYMVPGNANCYFDGSTSADSDALSISLTGPNAYGFSAGPFPFLRESPLRKTVYVNGANALKASGLYTFGMKGKTDVTWKMTVIQ